jgi:hypothetical protein
MSTISGGSKEATLLKEKRLKLSGGREVRRSVTEPTITSAATRTTTSTSLAPPKEVSPFLVPADLMASAKKVTPAPIPLSESVFQSGMRSVKRLLFGRSSNREDDDQRTPSA